VAPDSVRYELDEYYFMPDPHQLIFSHFPDSSDWQLLDQPLSLSAFEDLVPVKSAFFKSGLRVMDYRKAVIRVEDEFCVRIGFPSVKVYAHIHHLTDLCLVAPSRTYQTRMRGNAQPDGRRCCHLANTTELLTTVL